MRKRRSRRRRSQQSRRRPPAQPATQPATRTEYPSPAERQRIIKRRENLIDQIIPILVMTPPGEHPPQLSRLVQTYGLEEVTHVLDIFQRMTTSRELIGDESMVYREYRHAFARFGGNSPFFSKQEYDDLTMEQAKLHAKRKIMPLVRRSPNRRERELSELLLIGAHYWEDITPPSVPPRPANHDAPPAGSYQPPTRTLLEWGWNLDQDRIANNARNTSKWRPAISELVRMTLDDGLLDGWPGQAASWAPYHALHLLGHLYAHEVAGQLLTLLDRENDWLSDRLPSVWAQMGPKAEPPLWEYLDDARLDPEQRSITLRGFMAIAEAHPKRRGDVVAGLIQHLRHSSADEATINGYIVHILDRMQAVEAKDAIVKACKQDKVDTNIMQLHDLTLLGAWRLMGDEPKIGEMM